MPPSDEQKQALARAVQRAVLDKVRCWNALRDAEVILGCDIDDFETQIDEIAIGVDDQYPFEQAVEFANRLLEETKDVAEW